MNGTPRKLSLDEWDGRYTELRRSGLMLPPYAGPLREHLTKSGDLRLTKLQLDNSAAALRLWNFLLSENDRLHQARAQGEKIVGTMKDLGTVPVMAYSLPRLRAFYPDGTWWTPCLMECSDRLLQQAEALGLDPSFCPVRAMLPAFLNEAHFPKPDLLVCSAGAVCDDFSAIAQRLETLGFPILWWEVPRRRSPDAHEPACTLPGGLTAPKGQVDCVREELERIGLSLAELAGVPLTSEALSRGIRIANRVRHLLEQLRRTVYGAPGAPLPALEMLVAEMLAIHFCSDREECIGVLRQLLREAQARIARGQFIIPEQAVRIYWVNPVADLRIMNWLEDFGGRICGTDYMFSHALDPISQDLPPWEALARTALADPMVGPTDDRAARVVRECQAARAEAVVVCRIPGASHCAREGIIIREAVQDELQIPAIELEVPPICDAMLPTLSSRIQALIETAKARRATLRSAGGPSPAAL